MPQVKSIPVRSARPSRGAAQVSKAINNALLGTKKKIGPASLGRPVPTGGIGVKKMLSKRNKGIKIKKLLSQFKLVTVKKNEQVLRRMTVVERPIFQEEEKKYTKLLIKYLCIFNKLLIV